MKTAIVYYSMGGNTAYAAEKIREKLDAETDLIELVPEKAYPDKGFRKFFWGGKSAVMSEKPKLRPYSFDADSYDSVMICFPVWASRVAPPIRTFAESFRDALKGKSISVVACQSGSGAEKAFAGLKKVLDISSFAAEMILIDPKEKPEAGNEEKIADFCRSLNK